MPEYAFEDPQNTLVLELSTGRVVIDLAPEIAPQNVERIKTLARADAYDNVAFHRVIPGFVAQAGDVEFGDLEDGYSATRLGTGGSALPDLPLEPSSEPFVRGIVAMARSAAPDSANSQFFITYGEARFLDGQYTVVGEVIEGMEAVDALKAGTAQNNGFVPFPPDRILDAVIVADFAPEPEPLSRADEIAAFLNARISFNLSLAAYFSDLSTGAATVLINNLTGDFGLDPFNDKDIFEHDAQTQDAMHLALNEVFLNSDAALERMREWDARGETLHIWGAPQTEVRAGFGDAIFINTEKRYYISNKGTIEEFSLGRKLFHEFVHLFGPEDLLDRNGTPVRGSGDLVEADYLTPDLDHMGETIRETNRIMAALGETPRGGYAGTFDFFDKNVLIAALADLGVDIRGAFDQVVYNSGGALDTSGRIIDGAPSADLVILRPLRYVAEDTSEAIVVADFLTAETSVVRLGGGDDLIVGIRGLAPDFGDDIDAGAGDDTLYGLEGDDTLRGASGDDVIVAGPGDDRIEGGDGADTAVFSGVLADHVFGRDGDALLVFGPEGDDRLLDIEIMQFADMTQLASDVMVDEPTSISLNEPHLSDEPTGNLAGNVSETADRLDGTEEADVITALAGNDVVKSFAGDDFIDTGAGDDIALSGSGNDTVLGGDGADTIKSGAGEDSIDGGDGDDVILSGNDNDTILGGDGNDTIKPGRGDDSMDGGAGNDILVGFRGDEVLNGGAGNDTLLGNLDDDTLIGGAGDDRMQGGPGRDVFVFDAPDWGDDRIVLDFRPGSDTLDFTGSGLTRADLSVTQAGDNVLVEAGDSSIIVNSQRFGALDVADFDSSVLIF